MWDLSDTLGGKPSFRVSLQRSLRSLPPFHGAFGDEFIIECSIEGWQAGACSRRPLEGDPIKGSSSKIVCWGAPVGATHTVSSARFVSWSLV